MENNSIQIAQLAQQFFGKQPNTDKFISEAQQVISRATNEGEKYSGELRAMLEAVPESFFHINPQDEIVSFKLAANFCDLGRKPPASDEDLFACFPPGLSPQLRTLFNQCRTSGEACHSEISLKDILQKKHVYSIRVLPKPGQHLMIVLRDVTQPYRDDLSIAQSLERLTHQNTHLSELAASLDTISDQQALLEISAKKISDTLNAARVSIWFLNTQENQLTCACRYHGKSRSFEQTGKSIPGEKFFAYCLSIGEKPVLAATRDTQAPRTYPFKPLEHYRDDSVLSFIDAPLTVNKQAVGMLAIDACETRQWAQDEQHFAAAMAQLISLAHQKAQTHQEAKPSDTYSKFRVLAEQCNMPLFAYAESFLYANPAMENLSGFKLSQLKKFGVELLLGSEFTQHFPTTPPSRRLIEIYAQEGISGLQKLSIPLQVEVEITPANSLARWLHVSVVPICLEGENAWLASAVDISDRKLAETKLRYKAYHDDLTGLPNRAMFTGKLEQSFEKRSRDKFYRFAILFMELDRFNFVKKNLGQLNGEQFLVDAAKRLREICRYGDTLARLGGNDFTLLMENVANIEEVLSFAQKIQAFIHKPFLIGESDVETTLSIGVAYSNRRYEKVDDALKDAETALFRAKSRGEGNCEVFNARTLSKTQKLIGVDKALEDAIENNKLQLLYQPTIELSSGKLTGFEALLRWKIRGDDYISPKELILVAEESGHMIPLGKWVLKTACQQLLNWLNHDANLRLCINLSPRELEKTSTSEFIHETLNTLHIPPQNLQLDIQENTAIEEGSNAFKNLHALRSHGCDICLDDFGSGTSSLSYLSGFPFKLLKMDSSLVNKFENDDLSKSLLKTNIYAAKQLNMKVVAEGVETPAQLNALKRFGCHFAQGFLFSKPMTDKVACKLVGRRWNLANGTIQRDMEGKISDFFG